MEIRREQKSDIAEITKIHDQVFKGPYEGKLVESLRKSGNLTISLVCEKEGRIIGHIAYSPILNAKDEVIGLGLAPVSVLDEYRGQGVGSKLINAGNEIALSTGFLKVFVVGEPGYYSKFGFSLAKKFNYFSKFDTDGEHFMVLGNNINPAAEKMHVEYSKEFV